MQATLWIIDGFNLIRSDARLSGEERAHGSDVAKALLESQLSVFLASQPRGASLVLCYDGTAPPGARERRRGFRILHSSPGGNADELVLNEARAHATRARVIVVTSDIKDIAGRLRGLKADHVFSSSFSRKLWGEERGKKDGADGADKPRQVPKTEMNYWLERFTDEEPRDKP